MICTYSRQNYNINLKHSGGVSNPAVTVIFSSLKAAIKKDLEDPENFNTKYKNWDRYGLYLHCEN